MKPAEFERWIGHTRIKRDSRSYDAARLQLVDGLSGSEAGRQTGITRAAAWSAKEAVLRQIRERGGFPDHFETVTVTVPPETADQIREMARDALEQAAARDS